MLAIKILGMGCQKHKTLKANLLESLEHSHLEANIQEVTDVEQMMRHNVEATPALLVEGELLFQGEIPDAGKIEEAINRLIHKNQKTMKTILVPVDFSETAQGACRFALQLAKELSLNIRVVHVYHHPIGAFDINQPYIPEPASDMEQLYNEKLSNFVKECSGNDPGPKEGFQPQVSLEAKLGFAVDDLVEMSQSPDVFMIVMGTTGEHNAIEKFIGSISSDVSQRAACPVLLVPKGCVCKGFHNIAYASDYASADETAVKKVLEWASRFSATVHFVHVTEQRETSEKVEELFFERVFQNTDPVLAINMASIKSDSVEDGLNDYVEANNIDLAVVVTKQRSFWQRLVHRSTTKAMALNTHVPLMVLHI